MKALLRFFGIVAATVEALEFGPDQMFAAGDKVVSLGHERVRVKATGKVFETAWVHIFTIHDRKIVRLREYYDTATMAEAFKA